MEGAILVNRPLFEIDPKTHLYGADVVVLARAADRTSEEHDVIVVLISPILEAHAVVDSIRYILVYVPYLDSIRPGRGITNILSGAPVEAGVRMVMFNRAEHLITFTVLEKMMQCAAEAGLATAMCASSLAKARVVVFFSPGLFVAELAKFIGTGEPLGFDYVEVPNRAVCETNPDVRALQGVGVSTPADVEAVIRNGAGAAGSSNAVTTASDPLVMTEAMIRAARRGWDARPRS